MALEMFALVVIGVLIAVVIWLVVLLGLLPGNVAHRRGHPQADGIRVLGWIAALAVV